MQRCAGRARRQRRRMRLELVGGIVAGLLLASGSLAQTVTPIGPRSETLAEVHVSPHDPDLVLGRPDPQSSRRGLLRSTDGGVSFDAVLNAAPVVYTVCFHPSEPDSIWAMGPSLYTSGDGGLTWSIRSGPGNAQAAKRLVYGAAEGALYLGSSYYNDPYSISLVHRSLDGGESWETRYGAPVPELRLSGLHVRSGDADTLYAIQTLPPSAGGARSVVRSLDGGETWVYQATPSPGVTHYVLTGHLRIHPDDTNLMFATAEVPQGDFAVVSTNGGESFDLFNGPWGGPEFVHPEVLADGTVQAFTLASLWQSNNLGATWVERYTDPATWPPRDWDGTELPDLLPHPTDDDRLFLLAGESYLHTDDAGLSWSLGADGMTPLPVLGVQASPADPDRWTASTWEGLFLTRDAGASWSFALLETLPRSTFHPTDPDRFVRWGFLGIPDLTVDGGMTWTTLEPLGNVTDFAFHPTDPDRMVCVANPPGLPPGGYYSEDGGVTWLESSNAAAYAGFVYTEPLNPDRVLMLRMVGQTMQLEESLDAGASYAPLEPAMTAFNLAFSRDDASMIAVHTNDSNEVEGLYAPDRTGPFTTPIPLPGSSYRELEPAPDGWLAVTNTSGTRLYVSADMGQSWMLRYEAASSLNVLDGRLAVLPDGTLLFAAGDDGLLRITDALSVDGDPTDRAASPPAAVTLAPVYPNPFNGTATVTVQVHQPGRYGLAVSDILGRTVWSLPVSTWTPGERRITLDGSPWPSGSYWLRLTGDAGTAEAVRRLTLVK